MAASDRDYGGGLVWDNHSCMVAHFRDWIARHPDQFHLVTSPDDLTHARKTGRLGICFDIEGMDALGGQLSMVQLYYDLSDLWMSIAHNQPSAAGGSGTRCRDEGSLQRSRKYQSKFENLYGETLYFSRNTLAKRDEEL